MLSYITIANSLVRQENQN